MSDIQNVYRSQRSNFIILIFSSLLLAFIINIMSNIFSEFIPHSNELYVVIIIISVSLLAIIIYYGFATPIAIHKAIKIPLIFNIEHNTLKVIAIEGYRILKDLEYELSEYFKKIKDSEKYFASLFTKYSSWDDNELSHFINDLIQYIVWDIFHYFHHSNQKVLRKEDLYHIDYDAYPEELKDNFLLSFHHDEREKLAEIHRKRGEKVSKDYYKLKFVSKFKLLVNDKPYYRRYIEIRSKYGNIMINLGHYSLPVDFYSIRNLTSIKLDFHSRNESTFAYLIHIDISVRFSKFSSFYSRYEDYIEWINDFLYHFDSFDWNKHLEYQIRDKILRFIHE